MGARRGGRGHQAEEKEGLIDDLRACLLRRRWRGEEVEAGDGYFQCGQIVHIADEDPKMTELGVLDPPHVLPLMDFVRHLRAQGLSVPSVDPKDGGIFARALFLQVTPGPKAVGTQFVSQDNPDWTARNMKRTLGEAGFLRSDVVLWNVVPYCISTIDRNKNPTVAQIIEAIPYTQAFIDELKSLRVVVYCGLDAQKAQKYLRFPAGVHQLLTYHLSPKSFNHSRLSKDIQATFKRAYDLVMH